MFFEGYDPPDYYLLDEFLTGEHKIIRGAIRNWVNRSVKSVIEAAAHEHTFPVYLVKEPAGLGTLGPFTPQAETTSSPGPFF